MTTALAVTFGAGPAAAEAGPQLQAAVQPYEFTDEVNPDCVDIRPPLVGFTEQDTDNAPMNGETINFTFNGNNGSITLGVSNSAQGQLLSFDFNDTPFAAAVVIVKGSNNANIYDYRTTMAGQIEADNTLHAPINPSGGFANLSHVAFCVVPDGDNT
ncbi:hypothetical protein ACFZBP_25510 [Streptomyces sp. NPDC008086]|uniref:hypothetical protein n=1 Tax=Streptomyces sp. NPDC008086 TaxID=3364807 RepID=UPI0036EEE3E3